MNRVLMKAIIESLVFLGLSEEDVIDPDVSTTQLENLAFILKELTAEDKLSFTGYIHELAQQYAENDEERANFLLSLPENLGISD
jgi:hypothetical protein